MIVILDPGAIPPTLVGLQILGVLAREVRIRRQMRQGNARDVTLTEILACLPAGSKVNHRQADGTDLTITVSAGPGHRHDR